MKYKNKKEVIRKLMSMGYNMKDIRASLKIYSSNNNNEHSYNIQLMIESLDKAKQAKNEDLLTEISSICDLLDWKLISIPNDKKNNDAIYCCFALEIYGDIDKYTEIKK